MSTGRTLLLYSRSDCHLCDEAREALERLAAMRGDFRCVEIDIDADDRLHIAYLERVPVIELEGRVICELGFDADAVAASLDTVSE